MCCVWRIIEDKQVVCIAQCETPQCNTWWVFFAQASAMCNGTGFLAVSYTPYWWFIPSQFPVWVHYLLSQLESSDKYRVQLMGCGRHTAKSISEGKCHNIFFFKRVLRKEKCVEKYIIKALTFYIHHTVGDIMDITLLCCLSHSLTWESWIFKIVLMRLKRCCCVCCSSVVMSMYSAVIWQI